MDVREPVTALLVVLICSLITAHAESSEPSQSEGAAPCDSEEHRQFDFWLGDWELTWEGADSQELRATNRVSSRYRDCAIYEDFSAPSLRGFAGMSVSSYDRNAGAWRQTWVDNRGSYLEFQGEFRDGRMILSREGTQEGAPAVWRMTWFNISRDSLDWNYEVSRDGGSTWKSLRSIHYERKRSAGSPNGSPRSPLLHPLPKISSL